MLDENRYPTQRLLRCGSCGNVYVAGLTGAGECPDCESDLAKHYHPGDDGSGDEPHGE